MRERARTSSGGLGTNKLVKNSVEDDNKTFLFGADFLLEDDRAFRAAVLARPVQEVN